VLGRHHPGIAVVRVEPGISLETRDKPLWETSLKFGPQILRKVIDAGVPRTP